LLLRGGGNPSFFLGKKKEAKKNLLGEDKVVLGVFNHLSKKMNKTAAFTSGNSACISFRCRMGKGHFLKPLVKHHLMDRRYQSLYS